MVRMCDADDLIQAFKNNCARHGVTLKLHNTLDARTHGLTLLGNCRYAAKSHDQMKTWIDNREASQPVYEPFKEWLESLQDEHTQELQCWLITQREYYQSTFHNREYYDEALELEFISWLDERETDIRKEFKIRNSRRTKFLRGTFWSSVGASFIKDQKTFNAWAINHKSNEDRFFTHWLRRQERKRDNLFKIWITIMCTLKEQNLVGYRQLNLKTL